MLFLVTLNFYFKVKYWSQQYFDRLYMIIAQTITGVVHVTVDSELEVVHVLSTGVFTSDLGHF